jgi:hypothetical protein
MENYPDLKHEDNEMSLRYIAIFVWAFALISMAAASFGFIFAAGQYLDAGGRFSPDAPTFMPGMYFALKDTGSFLAGILVAAGLGVSYLLKRRSQR